MNASTPEMKTPMSGAELDRIDAHLALAERTAVWWVGLAQELDRLDDQLAVHRADVEGPGGFHSQVLSDAPRVAPAVAQLEIEHDRLGSLIREARQRVGELSGDPDATDEAAALVSGLTQRLRAHQGLADDVFHQAYRIDIGGE
ncbi:MAG: hypothetical protein ACYYNF_02270 [Actinomycetes bacterium]|jgi:hypothetical protein